EQHVTNFRMTAYVRDRLLELVTRYAALVARGDPPPLAMAAVDRAVVERQQQHAVRILVHDGPHRPVAVLAQRIAQLALVYLRFRLHRNGLHPHRTKGMIAVDQRQVVRADPESKDAGRLLHAAALVLGEA